MLARPGPEQIEGVNFFLSAGQFKRTLARPGRIRVECFRRVPLLPAGIRLRRLGAREKVIILSDAKVAVEIGRQQLDQGFFPSRWERASKAEKFYLRLMAQNGDKGSVTSDLADRAHKKHSSMTMTRSSLLRKGIIYPPALGKVAFTVPGMADYISRLNDASLFTGRLGFSGHSWHAQTFQRRNHWRQLDAVTSIGSPTVSVAGSNVISPIGVTSTAVLGPPTLWPGAVLIAPAGIPSADAFGVPTLAPGDVTLQPTGMATSVAFGALVLLGAAAEAAPREVLTIDLSMASTAVELLGQCVQGRLPSRCFLRSGTQFIWLFD